MFTRVTACAASLVVMFVAPHARSDQHHAGALLRGRPVRGERGELGERATTGNSLNVPPPTPRSEIVYLSLEGGTQAVSLTTLRAQGLTPEAIPDGDHAAFYGLAAGVRLGFLTLGARYRNATFRAFGLSTLDGELGARVSLGAFEPYFTFGGGYASLWAGQAGVGGVPNVTVHGANARAGVGVDFYADKALSLGFHVTGDVMVLARPGVSLTTSPRSQADEKIASCTSSTAPTAAGVAEAERCLSGALHAAEGSSFGYSATYALVMGLHF